MRRLSIPALYMLLCPSRGIMFMAAITGVRDPKAAAQLRQRAADAVVMDLHPHVEMKGGHMTVDAAASLRLRTVKAVGAELGLMLEVAASTDVVALLNAAIPYAD